MPEAKTYTITITETPTQGGGCDIKLTCSLADAINEHSPKGEMLWTAGKMLCVRTMIAMKRFMNVTEEEGEN